MSCTLDYSVVKRIYEEIYALNEDAVTAALLESSKQMVSVMLLNVDDSDYFTHPRRLNPLAFAFDNPMLGDVSLCLELMPSLCQLIQQLDDYSRERLTMWWSLRTAADLRVWMFFFSSFYLSMVSFSWYSLHRS